MRRAHTTWSFSNATAIILLIAAPALGAEPTPSDVESAKAAFSEGVTLRDQKDLQGALARFRAAYALVPTPITGLEVGRTLIDLGHVLEGRTLLLEVSRMPKRPGESDKAQQSRDDAAELAEQSKAKLATVTIDTPSTNATITVDEATIPKDAALAPRVLDPGHHVIVVRTGDHVGRAEVDLAPGQQQTVHIEATEEEPQPHAASTIRFHPGVPFWASVIVTGVGLVTGIAAGIPALATASSLSSECSSAHVCPQSAAGTLDASLALGWISTIGFAAFGVGAVASIVTFAITGKRDAAKTGLRVTATPFAVALSGTF